MNTTDYLREGYRQLNEPKYYTKLDHDPTEEVDLRINSTLVKMHNKGLITENNLDHLSPESCSAQNHARF